MKNILLIFLLLIFFNCNTQKLPFPENTFITNENTEEFKKEIPENSKIKDLENDRINFIIYHRYYIGSHRFIKKDSNSCAKCIENEPFYLIWKENNVDHIQKFDNCGTFLTVATTSDHITSLAAENFDLISSERIRHYKTDENNFSITNHSGFTKMLLKKNEAAAYNYFNHYNISSDPENQNINYVFNNNLKTVILDKNINNQIKILDSLNSFKRDLEKCKD